MPLSHLLFETNKDLKIVIIFNIKLQELFKVMNRKKSIPLKLIENT